MLTSANKRAFSIRLRFPDFASERTTGFQLGGPVMVQKRATSVCSRVRVALFFPPIARISARSRDQTSVLRAGGGPGRNCVVSRMNHGLTLPNSELTTKAVGV